ncbi:MAG: hypothetical protein EU542_04235 [Promethearchaeota archaeon]|nr:MAG: hypothetical protein EU542_04235 [Candidatus Lokiarchaeota archaeon]
MSKVYEEFMVYDLENTGERKRLDLKQDDLQTFLEPEQVLIIVREDLRRIFIWKGSKSPVRKRFISSKVAQQIQKELISDARYHRCKIVSIDQGDELQEFLNAFKLESMEATERLPDMRYIRNIERDRIKEAQKLSKEKQMEKEYYSPILEDTTDDVVMSSIAVGGGKESLLKPSRIKKALGLSEQEAEKIKEKILKKEIPTNYERQNLILGHALYGAVSKVTEVLGKDVVDIVWEKVSKLPEGIVELDNNKLRVYIDHNKGIVEAVEVLKRKEGKQQETFNSNDKNQKMKTTSRRELPKIPSNKPDEQ